MKRFNKKFYMIAVFSLITILLMTAVTTFFINRSSLRENYIEKTNRISQAVVADSKEPLWNHDLPALRSIFSSILLIREVSGIRLAEMPSGDTLLVGKSPEEPFINTVASHLEYKGEALGKLEIYFSKEPLQKATLTRFYTLLLEIAVLILLSGVSFFYLSKEYPKRLPTPDSDDISEANRNDKKMTKQSPAHNAQIEIKNEFLRKIDQETETKNKENREITNKLSKIIEISGKFDKATDMSQETFMKKLFRSAYEITTEADYGSVYLYNDGFVEFIDSTGHDLEALQKTRIPKRFFIKDEDNDIGIRKDIINLTIEKFPQDQTDNDRESIKCFKKASRACKQTLYFEMYLKGQAVGGLSLDIAEESDNEFSEESLTSMNAFKNIAKAFYKIQHYSRVKDHFTRDIIVSIIKMLEIHDIYTKGHSEKVACLASQLSKQFNFSKAEQKEVYWAGLVHDIGKILIPDSILNKSGRLTEYEFAFIKKHPLWGYETLKTSENLSHIAEYVLCHHERWDGAGYPEGLKEEEIPLVSRIITVVDAWDAMTSKRSYREPLAFNDAINEINDNSGNQFDPRVAEAFIHMMVEDKQGAEVKKAAG